MPQILAVVYGAGAHLNGEGASLVLGRHVWDGRSLIRARATGPCYNSSNGGTAFGTPWALNAQGTRGGPNIKWAQKRAVNKRISA